MLSGMSSRDTIPGGRGGDDALRFKAHWTIFLPVLIVALLYGAVWVFLLLAGKGDTALAKVMLLVLLLVVPVLLVRAYLRFMSFGLLVGRHALTYRRGWLRPRWHRLRLDALSGARASLGPFNRLLGGGAVVLARFDDRPIRLLDVESPEEAARTIARRARSVQTRLKAV